MGFKDTLERMVAAGAIAEFERLTAAWEAQAPMAWDPDDARPVADAAVFLLSDLASGVTAEITYVDGGFSQTAGISASSDALA